MNKIGRNDWNSKLVNYFLHNSRLVLLVLLAVIIGGVFSLISLRREGFPAVSPKVVGISTIYPGASTSEVETQITKVIENAIKDTTNLKDVSSTSQNSFSGVYVNLNQKVNLDVSVQEIRSKIASIENELPKEANKPQIDTFSTWGPAFIIGISGQPDLLTLRSSATVFANYLVDVKGVKEVKPAIEQNELIVVNYDNEKLKENNLTIEQINLIIKGSNLDFPLANLDINNLTQSVVVNGSYKSVSDLQEQIIGVDRFGNLLKLNDIASVTNSLEPIDQFQRIGLQKDSKLQTYQGVLLNVTITETADIIAVREKLDEKIKQLKNDNKLNKKVKVEYLYDQSTSTKEQVSEIISGAVGDKNTFYLLGGIQLVLLAMLLFVNWRAAIVAASAIPISFFFTLLTLNLFGVQLNTIVLFSLILVLGLIVDPAIVILESIQRYLDLGRESKTAVIETGKRYGSGLFIAVVTSIIVFVPFGVVSGIFGEIIKYIPLTVVPALVASYFVPLAILPLLSSHFLKPAKPNLKLKKNDDENIWLAASFMMKFNNWVLSSNYRKLLFLIVISSFIFFSVRLVFSGAIPIVQFSTPPDSKAISMTLNFPKGETFSKRDETAKKIEQKINKQSGIANYFYMDQNSDNVTIFINLKEKRKKIDSSTNIQNRIKDELVDLENVDVNFSEISVGPPESEYAIQVQLFANNLETLESAAKNVGKYISKLSEIEKVDDGYTGKENPQIKIIFDKPKLASLGLSVFEASQFLKSTLAKDKISKLVDLEADKSFEIFQVPNQDLVPKTLDDLKKLTLLSRTGQTVPLIEVAKIVRTNSIDKIQRFNNARFVNVQGKLKNNDDLVRVQTEVNNYLNKDKLKELGIDSTGNKGEYDEIAKSFSELGIALVIAIFLTYIVLVLQFNSFSQPIIMLFTIPLSFIGVFPALRLVEGQLGFLEILGLTILVGIVENVAIFLIDYANQLQEERNISLKDAIVLSSGIRFRPIILTKLVALGGLLPLAIVSPFWRGLSSVIIGGILVSGLLSMTVVPIFYTWFGAFRNRFHKRI